MIADKLYGMPRKELGIDPDLGALPKNGYNILFSTIDKRLTIERSKNYKTYQQFIRIARAIEM